MDSHCNDEHEEEFLLGNEAIARGAIEAGIGFIAGYPGTPSSEIIETLARYAEDYGIYVEWSTNEMVAFENALGASLAGLRSMVTMKHAGMNWIVDPLSIAVLSGVRGGLVIVTADDPSCHSSANEQDNRFYGWFLKILTLEPSDPQSAKDITKEAFIISEKTQLPVILRSVTRISHSRSNVKLDAILPKTRQVEYKKDPARFFVTGRRARQRCHWLQDQQPLLESICDKLSFNCLHQKGNEKLCIITSGVASAYVADALAALKTDNMAVLNISSVYPMPNSLIKKALSGKETVLVVEEGGPLVEMQVKALAADRSSAVRILGKMSGDIPAVGELNLNYVTRAVTKILGRDEPSVVSNSEVLKQTHEILPPRTMVFCAGCPHTGTMIALKKAMRRAKIKPFIGGDIGCYTLMCYPPHELGDAKFSMGASIGVASGISKALNTKTVAVIGDSTFIHAGIPGLINCVYNQSNILLIICDNQTTGMTGAQPHAGTGITAMHRKTKALVLEDLLKGCGVEFVEVTDPYDVKQTSHVIKRALSYEGVCVVISRRECALLATREALSSGKEITSPAVDPGKCTQCWQCVETTACSALIRNDDEVFIESSQCTGCGICAAICPTKAILPQSDSS